MKAPLFYSKILLFGEYGIIEDSKGLSIPFNFFKGGLRIGDMSELIEKELNLDLDKGMFFDSSIPQGYGVGSSGALVAAFYDRYAINKITVLENLTKSKILVLK